MDNSNDKFSFLNTPRIRETPREEIIISRILSLPLLILMTPFLAVVYVNESYSTVKCIIKHKIQKYNLIYEDYLSDLEYMKNIFHIDKYLAKAEYFYDIREAYVSLMSRKTDFELESCYHHKSSSLKDAIYYYDKKSAEDKLKNSLLAAENKMLMRSVIKDNEVNIKFN